MKLTPFDKLGVAALIVRDYMRATAMARGLGLTVEEWQQAVRSTSILLTAGHTPEDIRNAAMMHMRGKTDQ